MHEKGGFSKIKGRTCKQDLIYRGHLYFEPVYSHTIFKTLAYLKSHNKFYEDIYIANGLLSEEIFRFSDIPEIQGQNKNVTEKIVSNRKEMKIEMALRQILLQDPLKIPQRFKELHQMRQPFFLRFEIQLMRKIL